MQPPCIKAQKPKAEIKVGSQFFDLCSAPPPPAKREGGGLKKRVLLVFFSSFKVLYTSPLKFIAKRSYIFVFGSCSFAQPPPSFGGVVVALHSSRMPRVIRALRVV